MTGARAVRRRAVMVAGLALAAAAASAEPVEIMHAAPACIPAERFARVTATGSPADRVATAELQFRGEDGGGWYSARMVRDEGGTWSGRLPRPLRRLRRVEYRIVMAATDAGTSATAVFAPEVGPECRFADAATEVAEPIVVRVPEGAPLVPPVPPGFNPAGVVIAAGPPPRDRWRAAKWVGGAAVAVGVGALAGGAGSGPPEPPAAPAFALTGTTPASGSVLSASRDRLSVFVQVRGDPATPLTFTWFFGLRPRGNREACVTMSDTAHIGPERPLALELSAQMVVNGFCGFPLRPIDVDTGKLTIVIDGQVVHDVTHDLLLRIEP